MARPKLKVTLVALFTLAGCSQILGLDDYDIDSSLDPARGGDGNEAGQTSGGTGGNAGEPTNAGEPGVGGSSGSGGANDAGAAGTPGGYVGCDGTPFEANEAVIRSCILRVGCMNWAWPTDTISRCISQNSQATYEGTKCTLDAQTCDDITACEGRHVEDEFCAELPEGTYCNGDEVVICGDYNYATDCVKYGGECHDFMVDIDGDPANGSETTVACALPEVTDCTATTDALECGGPSNDYAFRCEGTVAVGSKCSNFATGCRSVDGEVACYYPVNTCNTEGVTCANDRATWCDGDTKITFDCASVGLTCQTEGDFTLDNERECAAPGCKPEDILGCEESCDGTKLTVCYGGAPVTVDCKDYGFKKCNEYSFQCAADNLINDCVHIDDVIPFAQCE